MPTTLQLMLPPLAYIYSRFWSQARWMLLAISGVVLAASCGIIAVPYVFSRLLDAMSGPNLPAGLVLGFVGYALLRGLTTGLAYCINYMSIIAAENLNFIAATAFFERLVRKTVAFFIEHNPVEIQTARDKGEHAIYSVVQMAIIVIVPGSTQILLTLGVLGAVIDAQIVLIVLVYGVAFIAATYFANKWTRQFLDAAIEAGQENARFVGSAVNGMETLRYFNGDRWISHTFGVKAEEVRRAWGRWARRRIGFALVFGGALAAQLAIIFALLVPRYQAGELSVGDIVLINTLLIQLNQPFEMIGSSIDSLMRAWSDFLPFARMWAAPEEADADRTDPYVLGEGRLAFEAVSFAYGAKPILRAVSLQARRGRLNFIIGETGSGKSTLFKLALKSLQPDAGRITADGTDIAAIPRAQWYAIVGVAPQDIMLLNDTIAANIVLGRDADPNRLRSAAERASVAAFIDRLPEKFDTRVGERGLKLSGGERQRIAIARALYGDPQILLLDEVSSALDEVTEAEILCELRRLADDVTILAITHRKAVIGPGDSVTRIEAGAVAGGDGGPDSKPPPPGA